MLAKNLRAGAQAQFRVAGDTTELIVDTVRVFPFDGGDWRLRAPARVVVAGGDLTIDQLGVASNRGGRIGIAGAVPREGQVSLRLDADSVDLSDIAAITQGRVALRGWMDAGLSIAGTRASPTIEGTAELTGGQFGDVRTERLVARASYAKRRLTADIGLLRGGVRAINANLAVPVDLSLVAVDQRLLDEPLSGTIRADSVDLGLLSAFSSEFAQASGRMRAQVRLSGTARAPDLEGGLTVANGEIALRNAGIRLQGINTDVGITPDSLFIRSFTATSGPERNNVATLGGTVRFVDRARNPRGVAKWILGENPSFALSFSARDFLVVRRPRVADLFIRSNLQLTGSLASSQLTGYVTVPRGTLYISELFEKPLVSLQGMDTTLTTDRGVLRDAPSELLENLDVRGVEVNVGDDVWLQSAEAKIQLGGTVSVRSVQVPARDPIIALNGASRADSVHRLALEGVLTADRGQYTLNLNVVQRTFQVERGTVTFFGDADLNPTLDISALYTVRVAETAATGRDLQIRARIVGTLAQPQVELSPADATIPLSTTDMISYLVTGQPSFELGAEGRDNLTTAAAILLPSLGSLVGDALAGSALDLFQVEAASINRDQRQTPLELLLGTRLGLGKQISKRTFVSATTNLCNLDDLLGRSDTGAFLESIGVKVEHSLNNQFSVALSVEPGSSALVCTKSTQRSFLSTPPQIGLDLFKVWRF
jgi:translocation and assembly module TamB